MLLAVLGWILALCFAVMYAVKHFELKAIGCMMKMRECRDVSNDDILLAIALILESYTSRSA